MLQELTYNMATSAPLSQSQLATAIASYNSGGQASSGSSTPAPSAPTTTAGGSGGYTLYNPDGSVKSFQTGAQKSASDAADIASGKDTPENVGGALKTPTTPSSAPITTPAPPTTPTNTPVSMKQPSPTTVNATPYTSATNTSTPTTPVQQAHTAATATTPAPQNAGSGVSAATSALNKATAAQGYTPPPPVVQAYTDATQKLTDDYNKAMSTEGQGKSLVQQYQDFTSQLGIPALNTELMNMKNIIDGTEDDVRNEVTKAGGTATESQILAMSSARNKTLIQNYNNLLQTRSDAMQQVQTLVGLSAQDREYASQQIDRQLNFDQQQVDFQQKALTNAQNAIQNSIATYGAKSVLQQALASGDSTAVSRINQIMSSSGVPFDITTAAKAPPSLDDQLKQAQISNIYSEIGARNNPAPKAQTQSQLVAQGYAQRANAANAVISKFGSQFADPFAIGGFLPTVLQSADRQAYEQAKREYVNSVLRPESGASISPSEFASAEKEYFPVQGDSQQAIYNKAVDRQLKINSLQQQGTNASVPEAGHVVTYQGAQYTIDSNGEMTPI